MVSVASMRNPSREGVQRTRREWRSRWVHPGDTAEVLMERVADFAKDCADGRVSPDLLTVVGTSRFAEWLDVPVSTIYAWRRAAHANAMPEPRWDLAASGKSGSVDAWFLEYDLLHWLLTRPSRGGRDWCETVRKTLEEIVADGP